MTPRCRTPAPAPFRSAQTFRRRWSVRSRWSGPGRPQPRQKRLERRGVGWEFVHVCIDDASPRVAFSQILPDEKKESAVAFLRATVAYYASLSVTITRVMTDNGSCYRSKAFRCACRDLGLKHIRTKPYTPKTNGKAERFIQTALREWAYAQAYPTSDHRAAAVADLAAPIQLAPAAQQSPNQERPSAASLLPRTTC